MPDPITVPERDPLYPPPPYTYTAFERLGFLCRGRADALSAVVPAPLVAVGDVFEVFFMRVDEVDGLRPYAESGIVVPCRYGDETGAHVAYEYVTTDDALTVGRELWGYPKKLADVTLEATAGSAEATCHREGLLMHATFQAGETPQTTAPALMPRFQIRRTPGPDHAHPEQALVVRNDLPGARTHDSVTGTGTVALSDGTAGDRLAALDPDEVLAATLTHGEFVLDYGEIVGRVEGANP